MKIVKMSFTSRKVNQVLLIMSPIMVETWRTGDIRFLFMISGFFYNFSQHIHKLYLESTLRFVPKPIVDGPGGSVLTRKFLKF